MTLIPEILYAFPWGPGRGTGRYADLLGRLPVLEVTGTVDFPALPAVVHNLLPS